jgi:uncharacterized protein YndB with AHSA1/START domain
MITITILLIAVPVILVIAFFRNTAINTTAAITIDQPRQVVFDYLATLKNQEHYNAWLLADHKMNISYNGAELIWASQHKTGGHGSQRIVHVITPETIEIEIAFEQPLPTKAHYHFDLVALSDTRTQVTFVFKGNSKPYYLLRVSHLLFRLKKRIRYYMEQSLRNVKDQLENKSETVIV